MIEGAGTGYGSGPGSRPRTNGSGSGRSNKVRIRIQTTTLFFTENAHCSQVLNFSVAYDSVLHGLGGYFECTLYKDIMLSILPATHSPGNPILAIRKNKINVFAVVLKENSKVL